VPDWLPMTASETVMVDLTPEALQNRMRRGDVYMVTKVEQALSNFFRRGNLIALRELALRQVAEQVDRSLEITWPRRTSKKIGQCGSDCGVCQFESFGAVSDRACGPHGAQAGFGTLRNSRGYRA